MPKLGRQFLQWYTLWEYASPIHAVLAAIHQKLRETVFLGKVCKMGQDCSSATIDNDIVDQVEEDPNVSSRILVRQAGISQNKVINVLHENLYYSYHFTLVQELRRPDFQKRVTFCRWLLEWDIEEHQFFRKILWTDEPLFTQDGMLNLHNWHHYTLNKTHF